MVDLGALATGDPLDVIYLCGDGRSGSTLLEGMLTQSEGLLGVGELRKFWWKAFGQPTPKCSCGRVLSACPLWAPVLVRLRHEHPDVDASHLDRLLRAKLRYRYAYRALLSGTMDDGTEAFGELCRRTAWLYRAIAEASDHTTLVDSSKNALYGMLLAQLGGVRVHAVHLVRDPRAVAHAWMRRSKQLPEYDDAAATMPVYSARRSAAGWMLKNAACGLLARSAATFTRVRYEDLVRVPYRVIDRVLRSCVPGTAPSSDLRGGHACFDGMHSIAGNPVRFEQGQVPIVSRDRWRAEMARSDARRVSVLTGPLLWRYGYHPWPFFRETSPRAR